MRDFYDWVKFAGTVLLVVMIIAAIAFLCCPMAIGL